MDHFRTTDWKHIISCSARTSDRIPMTYGTAAMTGPSSGHPQLTSQSQVSDTTAKADTPTAWPVWPVTAVSALALTLTLAACGSNHLPQDWPEPGSAGASGISHQ